MGRLHRKVFSQRCHLSDCRCVAASLGISRALHVVTIMCLAAIGYLVPLGAIGMTVFAIDLYFASRGLLPSAEQTLRSVPGFQNLKRLVA